MMTISICGRFFTKRISAALGATVVAACVLTGCGVGTGSGSARPAVTMGPGSLSGNVHGGQQPVSGSTIQLYAVGTTGNASAAQALLSSSVTTDDLGNFNITGLYTCPANSLVYMTATQGNPGLGEGANNTAIGVMAALGSCAALKANGATTNINIDEVTTVGAVYALAAFTSDYPNVGYAAGNLGGITNAFATANVLVSTSTGFAPGVAPVAGVTLPTTEILTLSDALANCIDSSGPSSAGCSVLLSAATPTGGTAPTNTIAALANIAHNPGANVAAIFGLVLAVAPYQPTLTSAPSDWTVSIYYTGGGLLLPGSVAIDGSGNAWVANGGGNAVSEIATGSFASGSSGYVSSSIVGAQGIAIDASNNVWLANTGADNLLELNSSGAVTATITSGISGPAAVAIDGNANVWVTNFDGNSVAKFTAGSPAAGSPFTNAALSGPTGIAIDASNNVWVGNGDGATVMLFNNSGVYQNSFTDGLMIAPGGVATDSTHGRVWAAATGISAITGLTLSGGAVAGTPLSGGGISMPLAVAVDGSGNVWTANNVTAGSVSGYTTAGVAMTPSTGLGVLNSPVGLALDASGNLWATSVGDSSVTEFIGLGTPTVTPLVASGR